MNIGFQYWILRIIFCLQQRICAKFYKGDQLVMHCDWDTRTHVLKRPLTEPSYIFRLFYLKCLRAIITTQTIWFSMMTSYPVYKWKITTFLGNHNMQTPFPQLTTITWKEKEATGPQVCTIQRIRLTRLIWKSGYIPILAFPAFELLALSYLHRLIRLSAQSDTFFKSLAMPDSTSYAFMRFTFFFF